MTSDFLKRREVIRQILSTHIIRDQQGLLRELARKGYRVTQSSVSRDLQELNVVKTAERYLLPDEVFKNAPVTPPASQEFAHAASWIREMAPAGSNLLVVQLPPGRASTLAVAIDQLHWPEVVGSIAGDDTIFIATRNRRDLIHLQHRLAKARKEQIHD
jgi:transcriptional regulator of arginine metabolism